MTAYMNSNTASRISLTTRIVWESQDDPAINRSAKFYGECRVHLLLDLYDGIIVLSDGSTELVGMQESI